MCGFDLGGGVGAGGDDAFAEGEGEVGGVLVFGGDPTVAY